MTPRDWVWSRGASLGKLGGAVVRRPRDARAAEGGCRAVRGGTSVAQPNRGAYWGICSDATGRMCEDEDYFVGRAAGGALLGVRGQETRRSRTVSGGR